jgi:hypothetical protein
MTLYASKNLSFYIPSEARHHIYPFLKRQLRCQSIFKRIQKTFCSILSNMGMRMDTGNDTGSMGMGDNIQFVDADIG